MNPPTDIVLSVRLTNHFPVSSIFLDCVSSLRSKTLNCRLILVDDNSDPQFHGDIESVLTRNDSLLRTGFQHWFTRAFNLGLRLVRTPQCVILNCDTILDEGWLEELYDVKRMVEQEGRVGLVGSVMSEVEQRRYDICQYPGYVTGHCVLLDMQALSDVSVSRGTPGIYLDETNPLMIHIRSDVEICHRMMAIGWRCVTSFKSKVGHHGGKTWGHQLGSIPSTLDAVSYKY